MTTPGWYARGPQGEQGPPGQGIELAGTVNAYADLPGSLGAEDNGAAYLVNADGRLYVWSGTAFPADGDGIEFRGPQGEQGAPGADGADGAPGADGEDGESAYQIAVSNGFVGNEAAWLASLVGPEGEQGPPGEPGADGADGADGDLTESGLVTLVENTGSDIRDALDTLYEGGGGAWGSITGTLADQTDLQAVLDVLTTGRVSAYVDGTLTDREIDVLSETEWGSTTPVSGRVYMVFED